MDADLQALIELFVEMYPGYEDPKQADGYCAVASEDFIEFMADLSMDFPVEEVEFVTELTETDKKLKLHSPIYLFQDASHPWYLNGCRWEGHVVVRVNDIYIDFTARQFDPKAPFPLVWRQRL